MVSERYSPDGKTQRNISWSPGKASPRAFSCSPGEFSWRLIQVNFHFHQEIFLCQREILPMWKETKKYTLDTSKSFTKIILLVIRRSFSKRFLLVTRRNLLEADLIQLIFLPRYISWSPRDTLLMERHQEISLGNQENAFGDQMNIHQEILLVYDVVILVQIVAA